MDTELVTLDTENQASVAEFMGIPGDSMVSRSTDALCRMRIWHKAIMGAVKTNGKIRQAEVVPGGAYRFDTNVNFIYSETVSFRPFLQRFRFSRWIPSTNPEVGGRRGRYLKSAFTHDYKVFTSSDLIDNDGGFNCGRPSGYIKDWKALPDETRKLITSVKRVRALFGEATLHDPVNEEGEAVTPNGPIPVIWEIENNEAFKILGEVLQKYRSVGHLFPQHGIELSTKGAPMLNGNMLFKPVPELDITKLIAIEQPKDNETLQNFSAWVANYNNFISEEYKQNSNSVSTLSPEEADVVESFITVGENN